MSQQLRAFTVPTEDLGLVPKPRGDSQLPDTLF